jgi:hypothetical protein
MSMNCSSDKSRYKAKCLRMAVLIAVGIAALGWLVMLLWNWLMPNLFMGAQQVGYCQALGILLLSKILFGNCHGYGRCRGRHQQWENMSPEEREQMKGHFKSRWSKWCSSDKAKDNTQ